MHRYAVHLTAAVAFALSLGAAAAQTFELTEPDPTLPFLIRPRTVTLYAQGGTYDPRQMTIKSGDSLRICVEDPIEYIPFFGFVQRRLVFPEVRVAPGKCHTYGPFKVGDKRAVLRVFSEIQANAFAEVWVMPFDSPAVTCPGGQHWHYKGFCTDMSLEEEDKQHFTELADKIRRDYGAWRSDYCDLTGTWTNHTNITTLWTFDRIDGGAASYSASETGGCNAEGTATLVGHRVTLTWACEGFSGVYDWEFDDECRIGTGSVVHTGKGLEGTTIESKLSRQ